MGVNLGYDNTHICINIFEFCHSYNTYICRWQIVLLIITIVTLSKTNPFGPPKTIEGNNGWFKVGTRFICKVGTCTQLYATKWLFNKHLLKDHNFVIEVGKFGHLSTHERAQDAKII